MARTRARFGEEPVLTALGIVGLLAALVCFAGVAVYGPVVPPEGKMLDAATFNLGVAVFTLTIALVLPHAGYSGKARMRVRRLFILFAVYSHPLETIQAFRGMDPRFSPLHTPVEMVLGAVFGLMALLLTVAFVLLGLRFFRRDVLGDRPTLRLALCYGSVAVVISFVVGILMSILQGRTVGEAGNFLPAHGLGVHGIQALPVAALLLAWGATPDRNRWIHLAGVGWVGATGAALAQALRGAAPAEATTLPMITVVGLALWAVVVCYGLLAWRRAVESTGVRKDPRVRERRS